MKRMLEHDLEARGITDRRVLDAFTKVPRERFVPATMRAGAYSDHPLPIGHGQTISQPYIVAYMLQELGLQPNHVVLEIGSGSGYVLALLSLLAGHAVGTEMVKGLAVTSQGRLKKLQEEGVIPANWEVLHAEGLGAPEKGPYHRIIVSAAARELPRPLLDQLTDDGIMIIPIGTTDQWLWKVQKDGTKERLLPVRFVPLI